MALKPCVISLTSDARYPGQTSCAFTDLGSLTFGSNKAPRSALAGIVNTGLLLSGVLEVEAYAGSGWYPLIASDTNKMLVHQ